MTRRTLTRLAIDVDPLIAGVIENAPKRNV
jgi:hypothetical protein